MSASGSQTVFLKKPRFFPFQGRLSSGKNIIITFSCGVLSSLFSGSIQAQRYILAIRNLRFLFLASTMEFVTANDQCRTEVNIQGMALKRSALKSWLVAAPHLCDVKCGKEITCQSYNYNRNYQICELNNRTKEAKTQNFLSAPAWFYIRWLNGRGKKSEVDFCFSRFSPHIANLVLSHLWLRNIKKRKQNAYFYCSPFGFYF